MKHGKTSVTDNFHSELLELMNAREYNGSQTYSNTPNQILQSWLQSTFVISPKKLNAKCDEYRIMSDERPT